MRTLATPAASQAAAAMRRLLAGDLISRAQELVRALGLLADPGVWDGPTASTFRQADAPRLQSSMMAALQSMQQLNEHADKVVADIMRAGSSGAMGGGAVADQVPGPVVDQATKDMLAYFHDHINDSGFWGDQGALESIDQRLAALTPAERNAFLSQLSPADLRAWDQRLKGGGGMFWQSEGLTTNDRLGLANLLFGSADASTLAKVEANMPSLQPNAHNQEESPTTWSPTSGQPLFSSTGQPVVSDINQGNEGDCWFLAGLGAVAMKDPSLITRNIQPNDNGTYTVTFYRDGNAVPVTVTADVPGNSSFGDYATPARPTAPRGPRSTRRRMHT